MASREASASRCGCVQLVAMLYRHDLPTWRCIMLGHSPLAVLRVLIAWSFFICISSAQENAQPKPLPADYLSQAHPFGVHDMVRMERVGTPLPSPDGKWIVFTV